MKRLFVWGSLCSDSYNHILMMFAGAKFVRNVMYPELRETEGMLGPVCPVRTKEGYVIGELYDVPDEGMDSIDTFERFSMYEPIELSDGAITYRFVKPSWREFRTKRKALLNRHRQFTKDFESWCIKHYVGDNNET